MDTNQLRVLIRRTGLRLGYVAQALDLSPSGLSNRLAGATAWREREAAALYRLLRRQGVRIAVATLRDYCGLRRAES